MPVIFTDSQEACQQIIQNTVAKNTNDMERAHQRTYDIIWTPGHVGILGIERADSLARETSIRAPGIPHAEVYHSPKIHS